MTATTTRKYQPGDQVLIKEPWGPGTPPWPAQVTDQDTQNDPFCQTCHCCPTDPEHLGDGSLCCPGPWYVVAYVCPDVADHEHNAVYAEHELDAAH